MRFFHLNPITKRRLQRFKEMKRAYWSFWTLVLLYLLSLGAELIANNKPLYVRFNDASYFPVFQFYPEDVFTDSGRMTRPDYKKLAKLPVFAENPDNYMIFPPVPFGPFEIVDTEEIAVPNQVTVKLYPEPKVGNLTVNRDYRVVEAFSVEPFLDVQDRELRGMKLTEIYELPPEIMQSLERRFSNRAAERVNVLIRGRNAEDAQLSIPAYQSRVNPPQLARLTLRDPNPIAAGEKMLIFNSDFQIAEDPGETWSRLPDSAQQQILQSVRMKFEGDVEEQLITAEDIVYRARLFKEQVRFPFRPVAGHWLGIDDVGRDVLARILYGLRISMTFGLILVAVSMVFGTIIGAVQGYFGGLLDISCQRLIEIWSALPFLYVMILLGSVYGRSFILLLFVYGLFNWIGISYYMRAEFLRLRKQNFVEAARCLGLPNWKILFKHILPNGLVPLITFFPFSLVGAIGALAALDYLGFGLPPPTPSWGQLLQQAQQVRWAWWLILYPTVALFVVMLLGVFVGEGVRNAFDPRRYSRII